MLKLVTQQDLVKYGIIPELIGRLPVIAAMDSLDEDALMRILDEPKNALIKQYKTLFRADGIELEFTPEAMRAIAKKSIERKTGARGLRSIMENTLRDIMFTAPGDPSISKVTITEELVNAMDDQSENSDKTVQPIIERGNEKLKNVKSAKKQTKKIG